MNTTAKDSEVITKKINRIKKLTPKKHKISHESGRSTKALWSQIVNKSKGIKK